jgi:DNA-directed RNA polymerase subunit RPC12/RpoP
MIRHIDGKYICSNCGHTARPGEKHYVCRCGNCLELKKLGA